MLSLTVVNSFFAASSSICTLSFSSILDLNSEIIVSFCFTSFFNCKASSDSTFSTSISVPDRAEEIEVWLFCSSSLRFLQWLTSISYLSLKSSISSQMFAFFCWVTTKSSSIASIFSANFDLSLSSFDISSSFFCNSLLASSNSISRRDNSSLTFARMVTSSFILVISSSFCLMVFRSSPTVVFSNSSWLRIAFNSKLCCSSFGISFSSSKSNSCFATVT
mmetsp:Transcript_22638/g.33535  ORF Transcript_22638/g.33535 Transcript_22638/m.33535 type:complete len:220 (+) Transcript_22638:3012-3671(+)